MKKALLALADGTVFEGRAFGYEGETSGEVVFNTAMTGYQEILTDPSYKGQIVLMTCPHIGNYGIADEDVESTQVWAEGFIVKEASRIPSNWRSGSTLQEYFVQQRVVAIEGVDTRALTRHIRDQGSQQGIISHLTMDQERLIQKARQAPPIVGRDLVAEVTCHHPYDWSVGTGSWLENPQGNSGSEVDSGGPPFQVVAFDFGIKQNILRRLVDVGCSVQVVPASTTVDEVRAINPDGIVLSNGPGDPEGVPYAVETVQKLIGWRPILGICLGHQIMGLALGMKARKLKFGHHGANHPVIDLRTQKVEITSQNHNFAVETTVFQGSLHSEPQEFESNWGRMQLTHRSLNDHCCEGMAGLDSPILSVQYHPEASPGPHDSAYVFKQFTKMMEDHPRG